MEYLSPIEKILVQVVYLAPLVLAFICGSVIGSLSNVVIYRLPLKQSLWSPSSHCPSCETKIAWYDNIPIFSWLNLRAKCRHCGIRISPRYIIVEMLSGILYVVVLWVFGYMPLEAGRIPNELPNLSDFTLRIIPMLAKAYIFTSLLLILSFIDLDIRKLPDRLTLPGMVIGLVLSFTIFPEGPAIWRHMPIHLLYLDSIYGFILGGGVLFLLAMGWKGGMGGGDIKLCAMMGAFLGWKAMIVALFAGFLLGALFSIGLMILKLATMKSMIPFGPYLALGGFVAMLFGKSTAWVYFVAGIQHKDLNTALESLSQVPGFLARVFHLIA